MKTFKLDILTPESQFLSKEVEMLKLCLPDGDYVVLAGHEPVTTALDFGLLQYRCEDELHEVLCADGFMEMRGDSAVVFTRECLNADNLDREQERVEKERMIAELKYEQSLVTHHSASIFLARAMERRPKRRGKYGL